MEYETEIEHIAQNGDILKTILLIHSGEDPNELFGDITQYCETTLKQETKMVLDYLISENIDINSKDFQGYTPLIRAILNDNSQLVQYLLENKANPNVRDDEEFTALHWAVRLESYSLVEDLMEKGADMNIADSEGMTPLMHAMHNEYQEMVDYFTKRDAESAARLRDM